MFAAYLYIPTIVVFIPTSGISEGFRGCCRSGKTVS